MTNNYYKISTTIGFLFFFFFFAISRISLTPKSIGGTRFDISIRPQIYTPIWVIRGAFFQDSKLDGCSNLKLLALTLSEGKLSYVAYQQQLVIPVETAHQNLRQILLMHA